MASVSIHGPTGVLVVDGQKVFPIGLSDPPPHDALAPERPARLPGARERGRDA